MFNLKSLGIFFILGMIAACGNKDTGVTSRETKTSAATGGENKVPVAIAQSCSATVTVGSCLMKAGVDMFGREGEALGKLMMNGNYTQDSRLIDGKCFAIVSIEGVYQGNSYRKQIKCETDK